MRVFWNGRYRSIATFRFRLRPGILHSLPVAPIPLRPRAHWAPQTAHIKSAILYNRLNCLLLILCVKFRSVVYVSLSSSCVLSKFCLILLFYYYGNAHPLFVDFNIFLFTLCGLSDLSFCKKSHWSVYCSKIHSSKSIIWCDRWCHLCDDTPLDMEYVASIHRGAHYTP